MANYNEAEIIQRLQRRIMEEMGTVLNIPAKVMQSLIEKLARGWEAEQPRQRPQAPEPGQTIKPK